MLNDQDITILEVWRDDRFKKHHRCAAYFRVYYYKGNIFQTYKIYGGETSEVKRATRNFINANRAMILADRADPEFKSLTDLYREQFPND